VINLLVDSEGYYLDATAKLADELRRRDVGDEEAMPGSGDSDIDELSQLPLRVAIHHVRLTRLHRYQFAAGAPELPQVPEGVKLKTKL